MANIQIKNQEIGEQNFIQIALEIFKVARPIHWIKNLSIFAALVFSGSLFIPQMYLKVILAFFSFSFATSATYIFNDIFDAPLDRLHPIKKKRPIASGKISVFTAVLMIFIFLFVSFFLATKLNTLFLLTLSAYLSLQAIYSLGFKNIPIMP